MVTSTKAPTAKTAQAAPKAPETAPEVLEQFVKAPKVQDLDFGSLTLEDAPVAELKRSRTTILDKSPVLGWLRESFQAGKAKAVTVPADQADALERLLRSGADRLTAEAHNGERVGVTVTQTETDGGKVRVAFLAKNRRAYSPRKSKQSE